MRAPLLIIAMLLSGCVATKQAEVSASESYPFAGRPRLAESEWSEIKKQFVAYADYDLMAVSRSIETEVIVQLVSKQNPYKGRFLAFEKEGGHWVRRTDAENTIQY